MKKFLSVLLAAALMLGCICVSAFAAGVSVTVEGVAVAWPDAEPFIDSAGRTMVPLRPVAEAMGIEVEWDDAARTASFIRETEETEFKYGTRVVISFPIGSSTAHCEQYFSEGGRTWLNWQEELEMDTAAVIISERTFAPIRYMAEFFGFAVDWDNSTRTVLISPPSEYISYYEPVGVYSNQITIAWEPGEIYEELISFGVVSASANGENAEFYVWSEKELAALNSSKAENYFYAVTIYGDFSSSGSTADISWTADWYYTDGTNERDTSTAQIPLAYGGVRTGL